MPIPPRHKPKAKTIAAGDPRTKHLRQSDFRRRKPDDAKPIDWLALWALSLAFSALVMAATAFFVAGDPPGAAAILVGVAAIIAVALGISRAPEHSD